MNGIQEWLRFFEKVSCFYKQGMFLLWGKYPDYDADIWDSLAIFLEGYAFERQGRRPDYFHAAVDALLHSRGQNNNIMNQNVINEVWQQFSQLLRGQRLNHKNNPLYPSTNPDRIPNLGDTPSVIQMLLNNGLMEQNSSFSAYLQNRILVNMDIQSAFNLLKSIRGVGDKVASFYLRDLVVVTNIVLGNIGDRYLLQPVDTWVERTIRILNGGQGMNRNQIANWIVNNSGQPELVNMGIWYFCSQIAQSEYRLNVTLNDINHAQNLVAEQVTWIRNTYQSCQNLA